MRKLQVFATDLNDALLDKARHGLYAKSLAQDVSPERLRRFFVEEEGGYRVSKPLREMVVFARQNLISDPPFSRMDLISCRNLLIYLEPSLQKKVLPDVPLRAQAGGIPVPGRVGIHRRLHRPVRAGGQEAQDLFQESRADSGVSSAGQKERGERRPGQAGGPPSADAARRRRAPEGFRAELNAQREADRVTVNQFAPPGVLINADCKSCSSAGRPARISSRPPARRASTC